MNRIDNHPIVAPPHNGEPVSFTFDGQAKSGFAGEMVSSALIAAGVTTLARHSADDAPLGIYCANGQCSQCTVLIDGRPQKSCVTALRAGMRVESLRGFPELPADDQPLQDSHKARELTFEAVVVGGGPSGITGALELARAGIKTLLVDDKEKLGGKLLLQTHKFFGSEADCYAGTRGMDIADILIAEAEKEPLLTIMTSTTALGLYKDRKIGLVQDNSYYSVSFDGLLVAAGAREKSLVFPGNDLPGVYGAGAFQTLVNRDLVRAAGRVVIIGSGNVGLIAAYHAIQAGITVLAVIRRGQRPNGYEVHAAKIRRLGVPIYFGTTILAAEGDGKVERVILAGVDADRRPIAATARAYAADTVLVASGLTPIDEMYHQADEFGFVVERCGDAEEIAEASSAMFGGRIAGLKLAGRLGRPAEIAEQWHGYAELLKSEPGEIFERPEFAIDTDFKPNFHCRQEIPCNPCATVCPKGSISLENRQGNLLDLPRYSGQICTACAVCVAACPGLAITMVRAVDDNEAEVIIADEFNDTLKKGDRVPITDNDGNDLTDAAVVAVRRIKKYKTQLLTVRLPRSLATKAAGIRRQSRQEVEPLPDTALSFDYLDDSAFVCRCERVTAGELRRFITEHQVEDINQLKVLRLGMGACGGKTCLDLLNIQFRAAGKDPAKIAPATVRPLFVETPLAAFINEQEVVVSE